MDQEKTDVKFLVIVAGFFILVLCMVVYSGFTDCKGFILIERGKGELRYDCLLNEDKALFHGGNASDVVYPMDYVINFFRGENEVKYNNSSI